MRELHIIVDLQFGSCGKGLFAGYLAKKVNADTLITAWAPNAGHTYIDEDHNKFVNIALPNGIVSPFLRQVLIGPGSVINPGIFMAEMDAYAQYLQKAKIMIHQNAAVVFSSHREEEAAYAHKIGSTMKGVGAAIIQKIRRDPDNRNDAAIALRGTPLEGLVVSTQEYNDAIEHATVAIIEGAQGFSLSMNQGFYPYTTSRDCTTHQLLSDCAIPASKTMTPLFQAQIHGVCRTYPIRVANRFDVTGKQIGTSGPCYPDQKEIRWEDIWMAPELTTVTKLPRRIFTFSEEQIRQAIRMNGCDDVFMNFANYDDRANKRDNFELVNIIEKAGAKVRWIGYGPGHNDIKEVDDYV